MKFNVIGLMSGTSLDGLDIVNCIFEKKERWEFEVLETQTVSFEQDLKQDLKNSTHLSAIEFIELHKRFAQFSAMSVNNFLGNKKVDFIASHGHTSIHLPDKNINFQLGDGATIAAISETSVICDFRSLDIALNGQGAPLVPVGDKLLFGGYDTFLNIGGFANATFIREKIIAFDISPANFALNYFSKKLGFEFDDNGEIGRTGNINSAILKELNDIEFYRQKQPKSLADHWFYNIFLKVILKYHDTIENILSTIYEHISLQIANQLNQFQSKKVLSTGGGVYNSFLMQLISEKTSANLIIPNKTIIEYKEAIVFAFLGVLRWINEPNCLANVTGAKYDNIGGAIYYNMKS